MGEARRKREAQQRSRPYEPGDAVIVFGSADGFRKCFHAFRDALGPLGIQGAQGEAGKNPGSMIASAVNVAFAVELYLKALRILGRQGPMHTHDLSRLYADLPKPIREVISGAYEAVPKPDPLGRAITLQLAIVHKDSSAQDRKSNVKGATDHSIEAVLERSRAVFETWRYLLDQGEPGTVTRLDYEFHYLGVAADVLHDYVSGELYKVVKEQRLQQGIGR